MVGVRGRCETSWIDKVGRREMEPKSWCGVDVAKETLEACVVTSGGKHENRSFPNTGAGHGKLVRWVRHGCGEGRAHYCLESTGPYGKALARHLAEVGELVSVVNPSRVREFGKSQGVLNKTDRADARVIGDYCRAMNPGAWRRPVREREVLQAMVRRLKRLEGQREKERTQLKEPGLVPEVRRSLKKTERFLTGEIERLREEIRDHVDRDPTLREERELLETIPAVAETSALALISELGDVSAYPSAKAAAAFAGLSPMERQSGSSVRGRTRISKAGNRRLRRALYMPAIVASRVNPVVRALYERLRERGKPKMVALGAAMRKLLMIAYAVLKTRKAFTLAQ
jgi:transposase